MNTVLRRLLDEQIEDIYFDSVEEMETFNKYYALVKPNKDSPKTGSNHDESANDPIISRKIRHHDLIIRDLFIWSILRNYIDMAKVFLAHMKYRICGALVATKILREFQAETSRMDKQKELKENAQYFENYAIECVQCCDKMDEEQTDELVLQGIDLFGGMTCLQVLTLIQTGNHLNSVSESYRLLLLQMRRYLYQQQVALRP